ncbi:MAG: cyclic lactone autoinducer peptide [Erysipelotrichaceae bacterium]|nr:cyclic lactone autoinducer peptide [Erysipelotrichaceae bacterium]
MKKAFLNVIANVLTIIAKGSLIPPSRLNCYEPAVPTALKKQD